MPKLLMLESAFIPAPDGARLLEQDAEVDISADDAAAVVHAGRGRYLTPDDAPEGYRKPGSGMLAKTVCTTLQRAVAEHRRRIRVAAARPS